MYLLIIKQYIFFALYQYHDCIEHFNRRDKGQNNINNNRYIYKLRNWFYNKKILLKFIFIFCIKLYFHCYKIL